MNPKSLAAGAAYGLLLWALSPVLFNAREPWDGSLSWGYLLLLLLGGFLHVSVFHARARMAYWSIYAGQFAFGLFQMVTGNGDLFPLGAIVLLLWNLPVLAGAAIAKWMAKKEDVA